MKRAVVATLVLAVFGLGCRREAPATPDVAAAVPADEQDALVGSGRFVEDTRSGDTGVNIPDAEANLLDEELCVAACDHLYELLVAEQEASLAGEPEALAVFLDDLTKVRPTRARVCVADCRRFATLDAVACVTKATDRTALDRCEF